MKHALRLIAFLWPASLLTLHADQVVATSKAHGTQLIELYTSQGCSSCPPAERWISRFTTHPDLWTRYVPVVFHVDYWDRLGWKDPFANSTYTRRQYDYGAFHRMRSVYTPGFFLNGEEWRGFFERTELPAAEPQQVTISGTWNNGRVTISLSRVTEDPIYHAAVLGSGFVTKVKRGENAGRRLQSDFTVLAYKSLRPKKGQPSPTTIAFRTTDLAQIAPRLGFAIWSTKEGSPIPVAATGAWLPKDAFE